MKNYSKAPITESFASSSRLGIGSVQDAAFLLSKLLLSIPKKKNIDQHWTFPVS